MAPWTLGIRLCSLLERFIPSQCFAFSKPSILRGKQGTAAGGFPPQSGQQSLGNLFPLWCLAGAGWLP